MKGIIINKDVESFEYDAWRGFSIRQIIFGAAAVVSASAVILFAWIVCYVPIQGAVYLGIPVGVVIALIGFMKIDDMTLTEYLKEMWRIAFAEPLTWQSEEYDAYLAYCAGLPEEEQRKAEEALKEKEENELHHDGIRGNRHLFRLRRRNHNNRTDLARVHGSKDVTGSAGGRPQRSGNARSDSRQKSVADGPTGKKRRNRGYGINHEHEIEHEETEMQTVGKESDYMQELTKSEQNIDQIIQEQNTDAGVAKEPFPDVDSAEETRKKFRKHRIREKNAGRRLGRNRRQTRSGNHRKGARS